jgi:HEAT repeat protein
VPLIRNDSQNSERPSAAAGDLLTTGTLDQRWSAARRLALDPAGVAALASALLSETEPRVREAILTGLARAATPAALEAVIPHLRSDDAGLRTGALDALRAMSAAVAPRLSELLHDPDPDVRVLACELVRQVPGDEASSLLSDVLVTEPDVNVCAAAVEVLAEVGGTEHIDALRHCAGRFPQESFLRFSIEVTLERISVGAQPRRG